MSAIGRIGAVGRLGLVAAAVQSLTQQALSILAKYGADANLYLPGVGAINDIQAGNWVDSAGGTAATVDNPVGLVVNARGGPNATQPTTTNKPILRRGLVNRSFQSRVYNGSPWTLAGLPPISLDIGQFIDGMQAYKVTPSAGTALVYAIGNPLVLPVGSSATVASVLRAGDLRYVQMTLPSAFSGLDQWANFDLEEGVVTLQMGGVGSIYPVGDGFLVAFSSTITNTSGPTGFGAFVGANTPNDGRVPIVTWPGNQSFQIAASGVYSQHVTAQQIVDAGGIPATANAPASSAAGPWHWEIDGSNDSFATTLAPANAGFICTAANVSGAGTVRTLLGAGAGSDASSGVWLARQANNALTLTVGNGTARNSVAAAYPVSNAAVASAGWDAGSMLVGVNNTETSAAKTVNCASANTANVGILTGTTHPMLGSIGPLIVINNALPSASERAVLRKWVGSLSGVLI